MSSTSKAKKMVSRPAKAASSPAAELELPPLNAGPRLDFLRARPGHLFRRAFLHHMNLVNEILAPYDLNISDYATLAVVQHNPGTAPSDVADALITARGNFVAVLDRLEKRKLVVRRARLDDRRFQALQLTVKGTALMARIDPKIEKLEADMTAEVNSGGVDVVDGLRQWLLRRKVI